LLDLTVWFDDGTSLPLSAVPDDDYSLLAETLNKDVVMLAPPHLAGLITISAMSPGSGELVRVGLGIDSTCPVVKRRPLVTGFAFVNVEFDDMVQSDASYYHQRDHGHSKPDPYSSPFLVSRDRIVYSHADRSRKGRRRKGKGRSSAHGRGKSSMMHGGISTTGLTDGAVPHVEAQQQRQELVIEAPRKTISSLELAMYILLAVFSISVVIFAANCLLLVVRRGRKQKLAEPKDPVLEVMYHCLLSVCCCLNPVPLYSMALYCCCFSVTSWQALRPPFATRYHSMVCLCVCHTHAPCQS